MVRPWGVPRSWKPSPGRCNASSGAGRLRSRRDRRADCLSAGSNRFLIIYGNNMIMAVRA